MRGLQPSCLLLCAVAASAVPTVPWRVPCPPRCVCQVRPWYTPRSAYREAATVDCNDLFITAVPSGLPEGTQTLLLQSNNIARLQRGELGYLRNLSELDLSQNSFARVRDFGLGDMPQLLSLHLEENQLSELPDGSFPGLGNLQELYLNHNRLRSIAPRAFAGLGNLLRLHLNSNLLRTLDSRWFQALPSLEILMVGGNRVEAIVDMNFRPLGNLRSLVLAGMHLRHISDFGLEGLRSLESLSFYDNELADVPRRALQRVPGLKFLDLNKNPLQRVKQSDFADMLHLKELGLNNMDELVSIDRLALSNLPELTKLDVTNNPKLSFIHPEAFRRLPRLETLMLNNNALSALHRRTLESLPGLQEIGIHGNPLRCDCVIRWVNSSRSVRFIEPQSTLCAEPPELQRRHVRDVPFRDMTEQCLPLISARSFPARLDVDVGDTVALHCRALAEPEPEIFWVTPAGVKLLPGGDDPKFGVHPEGTLEIRAVSVGEAGLYTCVAHNLLGADTRSVRVSVNHSFPLGPERLELLAVDSQPHHILLAWQPRLNAVSSNLTWASSASGSRPDAARIPSGTHAFNITRLRPGTEYWACLRVASVAAPPRVACVTARTKEA
ncbi:LRRN2 protein, partial [Origma solitaria]|nr:LRRN2 protein [Origma solitaria]